MNIPISLIFLISGKEELKVQDISATRTKSLDRKNILEIKNSSILN